jgi:hypothetical protein
MSTESKIYTFLVYFWRDSPQWATAFSFTKFLDHTQRRTTVGKTPLDEWSGRRRHLYLTTHNTHNRKTSTPPVGFEPTISAGERSQTYFLDRAATGTGSRVSYPHKNGGEVNVNIFPQTVLAVPYNQRLTSVLEDFYLCGHLKLLVYSAGPPLWSSGQSFWLRMQWSRVLFQTASVV